MSLKLLQAVETRCPSRKDHPQVLNSLSAFALILAQGLKDRPDRRNDRCSLHRCKLLDRMTELRRIGATSVYSRRGLALVLFCSAIKRGS